MHVHCLHWLMLTGPLFLSAFCWPCKLMIGEMAPRRAPIWLWRPDLAPTVSVCLSRPCSGIMAFVGTCTHHTYSNLYYLCHLASLFKLFPTLTPPCAPPMHSLIYIGPILMNSIKNHQNLTKISHYLLARLVVQKLIDN